MDAELLQIIGKPTISEFACVGLVTYFNVKDQYGFMKTEGKDVFFHGSRCYKLADNGTDLPGLGQPDRTVEGSLLVPPKRKDKILCIAKDSPKGFQAVRWVIYSDENLNTVLEEITNRKNYEVVICKGSDLEFGSAKTVWRGTDLSVLKSRFPKDKYPLSDTFYILINGDKITDEIR